MIIKTVIKDTLHECFRGDSNPQKALHKSLYARLTRISFSFEQDCVQPLRDAAMDLHCGARGLRRPDALMLRQRQMHRDWEKQRYLQLRERFQRSIFYYDPMEVTWSIRRWEISYQIEDLIAGSVPGTEACFR